MTYCIYHIPGKKIGVTNNPQERITNQQGYEEHEYEILEMSDDISYISRKEIELQKKYGYKVDTTPYEDLIFNNHKNKNHKKEMNINVTEQTTTFPYPVNKLKGRLMDAIGMRWETPHGLFSLSTHSIQWIMNNVKVSSFRENRSYIYNKSMARYYSLDPMRSIAPHFSQAEKCKEAPLDVQAACGPDCECIGSADDWNWHHEAESRFANTKHDYVMFNKIRAWAQERGLYAKGDAKTQYLKLIEEAGELGRAILKNDLAEQEDAIGDMVVVLVNLSELIDIPIEQCIESAYSVISKRTGKMVNGTFVKDEK